MPRRLTLLAAFAALPMLVGCLEDSVRFGPVGGLRVRGGDGTNTACSPPPGADGATCPNYTTVIWPLLNDDNIYACTKDGCHGGINGAANLTMPKDDPMGSYDAMAAYKRDERPYIGLASENPYFICNVWPTSPERIDPIMPIPTGNIKLVSQADLVLLGNWAQCDFIEDGTDMGSGPAAGAGGGGGAAAGIGGGL